MHRAHHKGEEVGVVYTVLCMSFPVRRDALAFTKDNRTCGFGAGARGVSVDELLKSSDTSFEGWERRDMDVHARKCEFI